MDKAKSMVDKKGASGPFHVNNGQSQKVFHSHVMVATNGSCCSSSSSSSNAFGSSTVPSGSGTFENMHHLHRGDDAECNGSPAKRCRLRRRTESVRKHRPRKLIFFSFWHDFSVSAVICAKHEPGKCNTNRPVFAQSCSVAMTGMETLSLSTSSASLLTINNLL